MTVQEVIDMAKYGELRNLKLGNLEDRAIVSYINLGLIELYKRFPLSIKEYIIELVDSPNNEYKLPSDCMWLITAYGEIPETKELTGAWELEINNEDNPLSINTVSWDTIQVPLTLPGEYISLIYAASPDATQRVIYDEAGGYLTKELALPVQLIESLLFYIGYRAHGAMDGNIQSESNTHYMRFDKSCEKIKSEGMFTSDDLNMSTRVYTRGYV